MGLKGSQKFSWRIVEKALFWLQKLCNAQALGFVDFPVDFIGTVPETYQKILTNQINTNIYSGTTFASQSL